jgi:hypothetical protein
LIFFSFLFLAFFFFSLLFFCFPSLPFISLYCLLSYFFLPCIVSYLISFYFLPSSISLLVFVLLHLVSIICLILPCFYYLSDYILFPFPYFIHSSQLCQALSISLLPSLSFLCFFIIICKYFHVDDSIFFCCIDHMWQAWTCILLFLHVSVPPDWYIPSCLFIYPHPCFHTYLWFLFWMCLFAYHPTDVTYIPSCLSSIPIDLILLHSPGSLPVDSLSIVLPIPFDIQCYRHTYFLSSCPSIDSLSFLRCDFLLRWLLEFQEWITHQRGPLLEVHVSKVVTWHFICISFHLFHSNHWNFL